MNPYRKLRTEQQRLREDVETLKKQVATLAKHLDACDHGSLSDKASAGSVHERIRLSGSARALLRRLPARFTVEDLIAVSEQTGIDVLQAYQDVQALLLTGHLTQVHDAFEKASDVVDL